MSFEAWHGSRYGTCWFAEGFHDSMDVAWFSLLEGEAYEFARQASDEGYLPTLCRVSIEGSQYSLFDASDLDDEDVEQDFIKCLKSKGVSDYWIPDIIGAMRNYEFVAFDPAGGGTNSGEVAECIKEMGYIGWMERESFYDDPNNFGLFDPAQRVTVIEEIKLCPERGCTLDKEEEPHTYSCDSCEVTYKVCEDCQQVLEFDEEEDQWIYPCNCDLRKNPSEICTNRFRDLKEEFDPSIRALKYNLSASVADGIDSYLQRGFSAQQRMVKDKVKRYGLEGRLPQNISLRDFGSALQEHIEFHTESLEDLEPIGRLMSEDSLFWHFIPPYFGYSDVAILDTPFWFVHFTSKDSALSIEQDGFLGREDTDVLYSTRHGTQSDAGRDGYIFGYLLQAATQKEALKEVYRNFQTYEQDYEDDDSRPFPYYVVSPHYIVAKADFGVEAFHKMDNERQVIIPTKCVEDGSIAVAIDVLEEFGVEWWDDE